MSSPSYALNPARDEVGVVALIQTAWRYRLFILAVGIVAGGLGLYLALTAKELFRAEVVITEVTGNGMGDANSLASRFGGLASLAGVSLGGNTSSLESQAVLGSRYLAEEFIRRNKLMEALLGKAKKQSLWYAVDKFRGTVLSITQSKEKGTTTVGIQWRDPKEAALWANEYVALANELLRNRALTDSTRNIGYLKQQIQKTDLVEIQKVLYGLVENETKINMLASTRSEYAFTVVDPAVVPEERVWPRRALIVLSAGALGGVLAIFMVLGYDMWIRNRNRAAVAA